MSVILFIYLFLQPFVTDISLLTTNKTCPFVPIILGSWFLKNCEEWRPWRAPEPLKYERLTPERMDPFLTTVDV